MFEGAGFAEYLTTTDPSALASYPMLSGLPVGGCTNPSPTRPVGWVQRTAWRPANDWLSPTTVDPSADSPSAWL